MMNAVTEPAAGAEAIAGFGPDQVDLQALATQIADRASRAMIEQVCKRVASGLHTWYDLSTCSLDDWAAVDRAAAYLRRRGDRIDGFRLKACTAFPRLVRFEGRF